MTTQENLAKHLGVNINEPFRVAEWNHPILHVDPNMGVVTKDGDRLSNVMLQELLFGDKITIEKLGKVRYNITHQNYDIGSVPFKFELIDACESIENIAKHMCYCDVISTYANNIAQKYRNDFTYIPKLEGYFDEYLASTTEKLTSIADINEAVISYAIYNLLYKRGFDAIVYNTLANYTFKVGLNTAMSESDIKTIIADITKHATANDTPQDLINKLIERTEGNGQNS